jgi:tetratricopeptide (TPR) repeat protein
MAAHEVMFNEAMNAIRQGERARARDLLTRLIKIDRNQAQYWLWMSTVVETGRERIFCLKEVIRIDPDDEDARRGLIFLGAAPPDDSLAIPLRLQKRNWQSGERLADAPTKIFGKLTKLQAGILGGAVLLTAVIVGVFLFSNSSRPTATAALPRLTAVYSSTPYPTMTPLPVTSTPTPEDPLARMLNVVYTPTPLYVNTPHPRSEAYRLGIFAYHRNEWAAVLNYMQQVATLEPHAPDIHYYIGEAYRFQERYSEALDAYNQSISISPIFAPAFLGRAHASLAVSPGRWAAASKDLEAAIKHDPDLFEAYLELAQIELEHQSPEDALARLEPLKRLAPHSPLLYYYRAIANLRMDKPELALTDALQLQQMDKTFLPGYRLIGQIWQQLGDTKKALEALETYTHYQQDDAEAFYWLGLAYVSSNDLDRALNAVNQAISIRHALARRSLSARADLSAARTG